jgi:hypothetical protein
MWEGKGPQIWGWESSTFVIKLLPERSEQIKKSMGIMAANLRDQIFQGAPIVLVFTDPVKIQLVFFFDLFVQISGDDDEIPTALFIVLSAKLC